MGLVVGNSAADKQGSGRHKRPLCLPLGATQIPTPAPSSIYPRRKEALAPLETLLTHCNLFPFYYHTHSFLQSSPSFSEPQLGQRSTFFSPAASWGIPPAFFSPPWRRRRESSKRNDNDDGRRKKTSRWSNQLNPYSHT